MNNNKNKFILNLFVLCFLSILVKAQYNNGIVIEPILKTDTTSVGQKIVYPKFENNEVTMLKVTIPAGKSTGWHKHQIPVFAYIQSGTLTVETEDGKRHEFLPNTCFSEVFDTFHNGMNLGNEPVILIAIYLGEKGGKLSEKRKDK